MQYTCIDGLYKINAETTVVDITIISTHISVQTEAPPPSTPPP